MPKNKTPKTTTTGDNLVEDETLMDELEPENLDQTDFVNNSSFSFQEGDVFPKDSDIKDLLLGKNENGGDKSGQNGDAIQGKKPSLFPPWLILIFGGFFLLILIIIVVVIIMAVSQGKQPPTQVNELNSLTENQKALNLTEERILAIESLEDTLVLPQTRELIIP